MGMILFLSLSLDAVTLTLSFLFGISGSDFGGMGKQMAEAGADLIIGTHPDAVSEIAGRFLWLLFRTEPITGGRAVWLDEEQTLQASEPGCTKARDAMARVKSATEDIER